MDRGVKVKAKAKAKAKEESINGLLNYSELFNCYIVKLLNQAKAKAKAKNEFPTFQHPNIQRPNI